jgi:hypothetical protein
MTPDITGLVDEMKKVTGVKLVYTRAMWGWETEDGHWRTRVQKNGYFLRIA